MVRQSRAVKAHPARRDRVVCKVKPDHRGLQAPRDPTAQKVASEHPGLKGQLVQRALSVRADQRDRWD